MRPGQNKRMRGRNNNRRGPNPLTRSYESNGPDVKIRGTAAHVAEKYVQLARDAHASGDPVAAESYLQHAEHYLRLIAAAQQAQAQQQMQGGAPRADDADEGYDGDDEFESSVMDRFTFRAPQAPVPPGFQPDANGDQPRAEYQPREHQPREPREHQPREPREHQQREHRNNGEFRRDRGQGDRGNGDRGQGDRERGHGDFRRDRNFDRNQQRFERPQPQPELVETEAGLPPFITAPVRIPIETPNPIAMAEQPDIGDVPVAVSDDGFAEAPVRPRRRRTRRGPRDEMGGADETTAQDAPTE